jgi:hypothetical protein
MVFFAIFTPLNNYIYYADVWVIDTSYKYRIVFIVSLNDFYLELKNE